MIQELKRKMKVEVHRPKSPEDILSDYETNYRVAAYCRVSTDKADQLNSIEVQRSHFENLKNTHPNWIDFEIYSDNGISGTSLEKRDNFLKMITLAKQGKYNLIITKDVSRLSRNVRDLLVVVDDLRKLNVGVYFLATGLYTLNGEDRAQLANYATQAENESFNTSKRVKFGHQFRMQQGITFGRKEMFGFRINKNEYGVQTYEIVEDEAETIRKIYTWFAAGEGTHRIARRLEAEGIKTLRYKNGWSNTVILRILRNEKYVGDLFQGKTYTPDHLTHKKKYNNNGESFTCRITDHHEAIVDRELFNRVQSILQEKAPSDEQKLKHSNRYWLSGKVFCGVCGGRFVSCTKKKKTCTYKAWVCFENHQRGKYKEMVQDGEIVTHGCNSGGMINDKVFQIAVHDLIEYITKMHKDELIKTAIKKYTEITKKKSKKDPKKNIEKIKQQLANINNSIDSLIMMRTSGELTQEDYLRNYDVLKSERFQLQKQFEDITETVEEDHKIDDFSNKLIAKINSLCDLSDSDFNDVLYERLTKKIIVYPEHILEIHLRDIDIPFYIHFEAFGKLDSYDVKNEVLSKEKVDLILEGKLENKII